jgi:predicted transcriptional regulator
MIIINQRITIIKSGQPRSQNINDELQWFGRSLGLFSLRDKDKSSFRVFIELLKSAKQQKAVSSDELAYKLNLTRGTVVHHLRKLMDAGIVISDKNKYQLRVENLISLVEEIERDFKQASEDLKRVARDIDDKMR